MPGTEAFLSGPSRERDAPLHAIPGFHGEWSCRGRRQFFACKPRRVYGVT